LFVSGKYKAIMKLLKEKMHGTGKFIPSLLAIEAEQ